MVLCTARPFSTPEPSGVRLVRLHHMREKGIHACLSRFRFKALTPSASLSTFTGALSSSRIRANHKSTVHMRAGTNGQCHSPHPATRRHCGRPHGILQQEHSHPQVLATKTRRSVTRTCRHQLVATGAANGESGICAGPRRRDMLHPLCQLCGAMAAGTVRSGVRLLRTPNRPSSSNRAGAALARCAEPALSACRCGGGRRHGQVGRQAATDVEAALQLWRRPGRPRQQPPLLREPVRLQKRLQAWIRTRVKALVCHSAVALVRCCHSRLRPVLDVRCHLYRGTMWLHRPTSGRGKSIDAGALHKDGACDRGLQMTRASVDMKSRPAHRVCCSRRW